MTDRSSDLDRQMQLARDRLAQIQQQADLPASDRESLLLAAIAELSSSLEELHVATEELQQQNEELHATRQDLDLERQRYQGLFDFAPEAYLVTDGGGIIQAANLAAQTLFNVRRDRLVGKPLSIFFTADHNIDLYGQLERIQTVSDQPERSPQTQPGMLYFLQDRELFLQPRECEPLPVSLSLSGEYDRQGELVRLCWLFRDLRGRKLAEQKISEQAALIDIATDAICVRNLENQILFWNKGAEVLYGWQAEEAIGKNARELLSQDDGPAVERALKTVVECGSWQGELRKTTKDNREAIVESRWTLVRDSEDGNPKSILTVDTDITGKKQLEAQFLHLQRLESLGTLASGVAHDFNNILAPILTIAQLLPMKLPTLDDRSLKMLELVEDSAKRGAKLVKQILAFARGGDGKRVPLQVKHLLSDVVQVIRQTFPKAIELRADISGKDLWTVSADATQLHQVLMNLCVNARDAMPNGGILSLTIENILVDEAYTRMNLAARIGPYIVITVGDTGMGIAPELLDRIFDPFFTTKEVGKGTGLGLSTVLGIVQNHGGFIKVESEVGRGTQFQVYLPAVEDRVARQRETVERSSGHQELILIVDDEPLIREVTKTALETHNYRTIVASDGIEAIELYTQHQDEIGAVVMDVMMPSMDGLTALRTLHKLSPDVKAIATSGLTSNRALVEDSGIGVKAFLAKPYTARELLETLQRVLEPPRSP